MTGKKKAALAAVCIIGVMAAVFCVAKMTGGQPERVNLASENRIDALSYQMDLTLDPETDSLDQIVTMEVQNNTAEPVSELCIRDMTPAALAYARENYAEENKDISCELISVTLKDSDDQLDVTYKDDNTSLYVDLGKDQAVQPGETVALTVKVKTDFPERADRFALAKTKKGKLYTISFCFPYLADNADGQWLIDPFFDDGESRSFDLADYDVTFRAPESYQVAATGSSKTDQGVTTIQAENVRDFAIVACDFMEKETFDAEGVTINNYYLEGKYKEEYKAVSKVVAADSVKIYGQEVGPCPYDEIDIVPCLFGFSFGGMEYPGLIMTNASSYFDGDLCDAWGLSESISHELGHQWFYASVGNREYREGWIDEGFTTYITRDIYAMAKCDSYDYLLKVEELYPTIEANIEFRDEAVKTARTDFKDIYLNVAPDAYPADQEYSYAEYEGGYMFLQEVRLQLGDEKFKEFLKDYYKTYTMKVVDSQEVLDFIRSYDNSAEMEEIIGFYFK